MGLEVLRVMRLRVRVSKLAAFTLNKLDLRSDIIPFQCVVVIVQRHIQVFDGCRLGQPDFYLEVVLVVLRLKIGQRLSFLRGDFCLQPSCFAHGLILQVKLLVPHSVDRLFLSFAHEKTRQQILKCKPNSVVSSTFAIQEFLLVNFDFGPQLDSLLL